MADAAAPIVGSITVEDLAVAARHRHPNRIRVAHDRREVQHRHYGCAARRIAPQQRHHPLFGIVTRDPLEAVGAVISRPQRRPAAIRTVQVAHPAQQPPVRRLFEQRPVEVAVVRPLAPLPQLGAHEEELAPRMHIQEPEQQTQRGPLLPRIAGHAAQQRPLAVHHLVVRQRQHEPLGVGVQHRERQLAVVPAAMHRIARDVFEHVVHPAHVPLEREPQAALIHGPRHAGPDGGFFRARDDAGMFAPEHTVQVLQEGHGLEVLAPALAVGNPLARRARIVEVEHRGHGIDAQAIDMELLDPVERVRQQERLHLRAAVVEDARAPVGMHALPRIRMLVEGRAIKLRQRMFVGRKMRRHPVEQHAEPGLVAGVDERPEVVGIAIPRRRRVEPRDLVAPRPVEGMLHHRQQFDVCDTQLARVGHQLRRQLAIGEPLPVCGATPAAEVHLVDAQGLRRRPSRVARLHPRRVVPRVAGARRHP